LRPPGTPACSSVSEPTMDTRISHNNFKRPRNPSKDRSKSRMEHYKTSYPPLSKALQHSWRDTTSSATKVLRPITVFSILGVYSSPLVRLAALTVNLHSLLGIPDAAWSPSLIRSISQRTRIHIHPPTKKSTSPTKSLHRNTNRNTLVRRPLPV
jgi:hypothetical protein